MLTESLCIQTWKVPSKFLIIPFTGPLLPPKKYIRDVGYSVRRNLTKELCGMFYLNTPFDWQLLTRFLYEGKPKPWWFLLPCKKPNPMISSFRITYGNRQTSFYLDDFANRKWEHSTSASLNWVLRIRLRGMRLHWYYSELRGTGSFDSKRLLVANRHEQRKKIRQTVRTIWDWGA